jgi:hypothetical protein
MKRQMFKDCNTTSKLFIHAIAKLKLETTTVDSQHLMDRALGRAGSMHTRKSNKVASYDGR